AVGNRPLAVAVADLNKDGKLDLVTANDFGNSVSVLLGNGNGTFAPRTDYSTGSRTTHPFSVAVADLNEDGKLDLVTSNDFGDDVSVLLGNGDGTFPPAIEYAVGPSPDSLAVADLDGDGKLDLVTASTDDNNLSVRLGNGDGTFGPKDYRVGSRPRFVALSDLDGDGHEDFITANQGAGSVSVGLGTGDGTFLPRTDYPVGLRP